MSAPPSQGGEGPFLPAPWAHTAHFLHTPRLGRIHLHGVEMLALPLSRPELEEIGFGACMIQVRLSLQACSTDLNSMAD